MVGVKVVRQLGQIEQLQNHVYAIINLSKFQLNDQLRNYILTNVYFRSMKLFWN